MEDPRDPKAEHQPSPRTRRRRIEPRVPHKIRYTSAEWDTIVECAHACGKPPAEYVRDISLGAMPKVRQGRDNEAAIRELGRLGNALAGLRRTAAESDMPSQAAVADAALAEVLAVVRQLGSRG